MWPDPGETQELLSRAGGGDRDAENLLLRNHREPLRRMVDLRLDRAIAGRLDASDVVQEVLVEAHRRLGDYLKNPLQPFHLWLRQIARDHMVDAHRRHRLAQKRSTERERSLADRAFQDHSSVELVTRLSAPGPTPAAAAMQAELDRRFQAALEELSEPDREVILLRHFEGLSNQEVARLLELSEPAVSMRYLRALRRLRAELGEE